MKIIRQIDASCNMRKIRVDTISHNERFTLNCFSAKVKNTQQDTILHIYTDSQELIESVAYNETYTLVEELTLICSSKVFFKIESLTEPVTPSSFDDSFDESFA